jgi:hypothetical protein
VRLAERRPVRPGVPGAPGPRGRLCRCLPGLVGERLRQRRLPAAVFRSRLRRLPRPLRTRRLCPPVRAVPRTGRTPRAAARPGAQRSAPMCRASRLPLPASRGGSRASALECRATAQPARTRVRTDQASTAVKAGAVFPGTVRGAAERAAAGGNPQPLGVGGGPCACCRHSSVERRSCRQPPSGAHGLEPGARPGRDSGRGPDHHRPPRHVAGGVAAHGFAQPPRGHVGLGLDRGRPCPGGRRPSAPPETGAGLTAVGPTRAV